jgi:predicted Zn finger-like uncharacterized protein
MDVRCSRCGTEYEFDDALISERGTTVKCTNCGFQFKIFPGEGKGLAPERWVVRTASGRELVYTSLRELQRGIADKKVVANDLLSRGKQVARPLGSIAELEPFFQVTPDKAAAEAERLQRTLHGVAPPANALGGNRNQEFASAAPLPDLAAGEAEATASTALGNVASAHATQPTSSQAPGLVEAAAGSQASAQQSPAADLESPLSTTLPAGYVPDLRTTLPNGSAASVTLAEGAASLPERRVPRDSVPRDSVLDSPRGAASGSPMSPRVSAFDNTLEVPTSARSPVSSPRNLPPVEVESIRHSFKSYDELELDPPSEDFQARVARSRWIAGVVVVGVLGLLGATVGRRYLAQLTGAVEVRGASDARVAKFLSDGAGLLDDGDFEGAKEEFDKATALAEKDPAVVTALARLETLQADVSWLKLRLLDPNSIDLVQATQRELGRRVAKARTAVDRAFAVSPEDPAVLRARVDVLRLSGDGDKAREWLAPLSANASVPENAYVLAALDLAESAPVWPSAIDRLRAAAAAEREPGRARAALVYALACAERLPEAEAEFAKIDGRSKPHPLLEELRAFLKRARPSAATVGSAPAKISAADSTKLLKLDASPAPADDASHPAIGDFRKRLAEAAAALRQGDLARANQLYNSVLAEQPTNTEAISGLGDVAKAGHDPALAARLYDRVLAANPSYLPAILASADQKWESGDRSGAIVLYRRLLDQAGPSSEYGARAAARIAQGAAGRGSGGAGAVTAAPPADAPAAPAPSIDTTDLPGVK